MHTEAINRASNTTPAAATQDRHHIALRETGRRSGGMMERQVSSTTLFTSMFFFCFGSFGGIARHKSNDGALVPDLSGAFCVVLQRWRRWRRGARHLWGLLRWYSADRNLSEPLLVQRLGDLISKVVLF